jgi:hypothetical protein
MGLDGWAFGALALFHLISTARLFNNFIPSIDRAAFLGIGVIFVAYVVRSVVRQDWPPVIWAAVMTSLMISASFTFAFKQGTPFNALPLSSYFISLSLTPILAMRIPISRALDILARVAAAYCVFYVAFNLLAPVLPLPHPVEGLLVGYGVRGDRFLMSGGFVIFAAVWAARLGYGRLWSLLIGALAIYAIYLSGSRALQVTSIVVIVSALVPMVQRPLLVAATVAAFVGTIVLIWALFDPDFNPYMMFSSDISGLIRANNYTVLAHYLSQNPILGAGLPPDASSNYYGVSAQRALYFSDFGVLGAWMLFGIGGMGVWLWWVVTIAKRTLQWSAPGERPSDFIALTAMAIYVIGYSVVSPTMFSGSAAFFCALVGGDTIRRSFSKRRMQTAAINLPHGSSDIAVSPQRSWNH